MHLKHQTEIGLDTSECLKTSAEQSPLYFDSSWGSWNRRWNSPALLKYPPWHLCLLLGWQDHGSCGIEGQLEPLCNHVLTSPVRGLEILNTCHLSQRWMLVIITLSTSFQSHVRSDCSSPPQDDIEWMSSSMMLTRLTFTHCMYCVTTVFNHPSVPVTSTTPLLLPSSASALQRACP